MILRSENNWINNNFLIIGISTASLSRQRTARRRGNRFPTTGPFLYKRSFKSKKKVARTHCNHSGIPCVVGQSGVRKFSFLAYHNGLVICLRYAIYAIIMCSWKHRQRACMFLDASIHIHVQTTCARAGLFFRGCTLTSCLSAKTHRRRSPL